MPLHNLWIPMREVPQKMKYHKPILILLAVFFSACDKPVKKLFWVEENTPERSDFIFLTESTNVAPLKGDSLKLFLRPYELEQFDSASTTYKNFGQIYHADKFSVFVLLRSIDTHGRDYHFSIRTFNNDRKVIDDFELGIWNETEHTYCFGSIDENLIIERTCDKKGTPDIVQITGEGKIMALSDQPR